MVLGTSSVYMPLNCNLEEVQHIRKYTSKPVYCAGRMQMDVAEAAIAEKTIDGVAIGRQILVDEKYLTKLQEGKEKDIRPCIGCHNACLALSNYKGVGAEMMETTDNKYCALNPRAFEEKKYHSLPDSSSKKIVVIGGGIGGMEFAIQAAKEDMRSLFMKRQGVWVVYSMRQQLWILKKKIRNCWHGTREKLENIQLKSY